MEEKSKGQRFQILCDWRNHLSLDEFRLLVVQLDNLIELVKQESSRCPACGEELECSTSKCPRFAGAIHENEDWLNEPLCSSCGHSQSRHQTAGGFCKHCTCERFEELVSPPLAPDASVRCVDCGALLETDVHCDNCGTFYPTRGLR